jgi:hypothetical protein
MSTTIADTSSVGRRERDKNGSIEGSGEGSVSAKEASPEMSPVISGAPGIAPTT